MLCNLAKQIVVSKKDYTTSDASNCRQGIECWALYIGTSICICIWQATYTVIVFPHNIGTYIMIVLLYRNWRSERPRLRKNPSMEFLNFQKHVSFVIP
jgi:hypothetical protein